MQVIKLEPMPIAELTFLNAGRGPGQYYEDILPVELAWVDMLPDGLSAIVVTSDLQGREHFEYQTGPQLRLLGEWLPQVLAESILPGLSLPTGVPEQKGLEIAKIVLPRDWGNNLLPNLQSYGSCHQ